jgi:ribosome-associated toxin RatA of RatAB toxin-antitoxin module
LPTHHETKVLPYTAQQMYDLVADVARYPEFLPWNSAARITARRPVPEGEVMEADLVIVDLASTAAIEQATRRAEDIWQAIFPTIMMGDDRAIHATWVNGRPTR